MSACRRTKLKNSVLGLVNEDVILSYTELRERIGKLHAATQVVQSRDE